VKKGIEINKDVFKRVSSTKETREFTISERTKSTNKDQSVADFVASQKRTSNTKGQESELAKDWGRFSDKGNSSVALPATKSNTQDKPKQPKQPKLTSAQRAQVEAYKLAQKMTLRPASISITSEFSSDSLAESNLRLDGIMPSGVGSARLSGKDASDTGAGNANIGHHTDTTSGNSAMGHQAYTKAGSASLQGEATAEVDAGNANMEHHGDSNAGVASLDPKKMRAAGQTEMGHHVGVRVSSVSLDGKVVDDAVGQVNMGHQKSKQVGVTLLEGRDHKAALSTTLCNTEALKAELAEGDEGSDTAGKNEKSVLSSRLAEKMSKIRSQSADITIDSEALQERFDKP
jgi:hypothetical protein